MRDHARRRWPDAPFADDAEAAVPASALGPESWEDRHLLPVTGPRHPERRRTPAPGARGIAHGPGDPDGGDPARRPPLPPRPVLRRLRHPPRGVRHPAARPRAAARRGASSAARPPAPATCPRCRTATGTTPGTARRPDSSPTSRPRGGGEPGGVLAAGPGPGRRRTTTPGARPGSSST
ncbi:hypothetical protein J2S47_005197 [Streptomyces griseoviridis]|uniref:Uncharacterized protein n=1 Tax=Streptomyces griseoviridis TaxID=45398 RepID=A0ABT9LMD6_STRGD|nr:hypothetical protein [Streptomyces griseoviridis]